MKNNIENFKKIDLQNGDWFDRTEFTLAQIGVISTHYPSPETDTFTCNYHTTIIMHNKALYTTSKDDPDLLDRLHPCDFFPESTSVPLSEGNHTPEAQTPVTEAPVDSEEGLRFVDSSAEMVPYSTQDILDQVHNTLQLGDLQHFILSHEASIYLKPEEGKLVYMVYMEDEDEYKIETKEDLDKLSGALDVLAAMREGV